MGEKISDLDQLLDKINTRLEEDAQQIALAGITRHTVVFQEPEESPYD